MFEQQQPQLLHSLEEPGSAQRNCMLCEQPIRPAEPSFTFHEDCLVEFIAEQSLGG